MNILRRITDAEVIAEFLKAEFYHPEYERDRSLFQSFVYNPDLTEENENAIRKALLFRRRGPMWRELPADVQWWEVDLAAEDLARVNVFPRAQWRRISDGDFQVLNVVERIRAEMAKDQTGPLLGKLKVLQEAMRREGPKSTVMLIGVDEKRPVTLLEGNHRFVSCLMLSPQAIQRRLRLVCGFSPNMEKCCWYKTDLANLFQYTKNRIKHLWSREADVSRYLAQLESSRQGYTGAVTLPDIKSE